VAVAEMTDTEWEKLQTGVDTRRLLAGAAQRCEVIGFRPAAFARASVRRSSSRFSSVRPPPLLRMASSSACVTPSALFRATARLVRAVKRIFFIISHLESGREAVPTALDGPFLVCLRSAKPSKKSRSGNLIRSRVPSPDRRHTPFARLPRLVRRLPLRGRH